MAPSEGARQQRCRGSTALLGRATTQIRPCSRGRTSGRTGGGGFEKVGRYLAGAPWSHRRRRLDRLRALRQIGASAEEAAAGGAARTRCSRSIASCARYGFTNCVAVLATRAMPKGCGLCSSSTSRRSFSTPRPSSTYADGNEPARVGAQQPARTRSWANVARDTGVERFVLIPPTSGRAADGDGAVEGALRVDRRAMGAREGNGTKFHRRALR